MALSFGVTVLPDPPYQRLVELIALAESHGFEYGWTYDSHVLWQESFPLLTLAAEATSTMKLGHCVTNPGTREPTVLASGVRDAPRHLGRPDGDGHRPRRLGAPLHRPAAREGRRVRAPPRDDQGLHERARGELEREGASAQVGAPRAPGDPHVGRRLRAEGARRRRPRRRRRDHPARRPGIITWIMDTAREAARGSRAATRSELKCIVCAPSHISDDIADAREQVRWFPAMVSNHVKDLIERYGTDGSVDPAGAHGLRAGAEVLRLRRALARRREARRVRHRRDLRPLLRARQRRAGDREAEGARVDRRRPVQHLPDDPGPGRGPRRLRERHHPAVLERRGSSAESDRLPERARDELDRRAARSCSRGRGSGSPRRPRASRPAPTPPRARARGAPRDRSSPPRTGVPTPGAISGSSASRSSETWTKFGPATRSSASRIARSTPIRSISLIVKTRTPASRRSWRSPSSSSRTPSERDALRIDGRERPGVARERVAAEPERRAQRHPVHVAARARLRRVDVASARRSRARRPAPCARRKPAERAERDRVVAAEDERRRAGADGFDDLRGDPLARALDLGKEARASRPGARSPPAPPSRRCRGRAPRSRGSSSRSSSPA